MTAQPALAAALERKPPPVGGFSPAIVRLEVRRLLRNRRTMILALALPVLFFVSFGLNNSYVHQRAGRGNVSAVEMISIALYGAVSATATGGAMVSIERASGWSRQLRVTPLPAAAYIVITMLTSLVLAAGAVFAVYLVGAVTNKVSMPAGLWVITGLCVWTGSLLFAAFGLFVGYLLPSENVAVQPSGQPGGVGVPVQDVERRRRPALQVVVHPVVPDQVVGPEPGEHLGQRPSVQVAAAAGGEDGGDLEALPGQELNHAAAGRQVGDVELVDHRRDDEQGKAVHHGGGRLVLDEFEEARAVHHGSRRHRQIAANHERIGGHHGRDARGGGQVRDQGADTADGAQAAGVQGSLPAGGLISGLLLGAAAAMRFMIRNFIRSLSCQSSSASASSASAAWPPAR